MYKRLTVTRQDLVSVHLSRGDDVANAFYLRFGASVHPSSEVLDVLIISIVWDTYRSHTGSVDQVR